MLVRRPAPPGIRPFLENKRPIQVFFFFGAEGVEPRLEAIVFVTAVLFVESPGLCVVVLVDAFLAGVYCCVGFTDLVVGVRIAWR